MMNCHCQLTACTVNVTHVVSSVLLLLLLLLLLPLLLVCADSG